MLADIFVGVIWLFVSITAITQGFVPLVRGREPFRSFSSRERKLQDVGLVCRIARGRPEQALGREGRQGRPAQRRSVLDSIDMHPSLRLAAAQAAVTRVIHVL